MVHPYQNKNLKTLTVSVFKDSAGPDGFYDDSINITYGTFDIFPIMDTEESQ